MLAEIIVYLYSSVHMRERGETLCRSVATEFHRWWPGLSLQRADTVNEGIG
jgi:hypothetical protein